MVAGWLMANRNGFSLVELVVALVLLMIVFLALQGTGARYAHNVVVANRSATAIELAEGRIEEMRMHPDYPSLASTFAGTETDPEGVTGLTRVTTVTQTTDSTASGMVDYKTVTVSVSGSGLPSPVSRTIILAAP